MKVEAEATSVTVAPITPTQASEAQARIAAAMDGMLRDAAAPLAVRSRSDPLTLVVRAALERAAASQAGLGQLMADLGQALLRPDLPAAVRAAAERLLDLRTPLHAGLKGADVRRGAQASGLFLEAGLAAAPKGETRPLADLKAALLALGQALESWRPEPPARAAGAPPHPSGPSAEAPVRGKPPPPFRDAAPAAQAPAPPSLPLDAPSRVAAERLLSETRAAVARQELHQIASLPESPSAEGPDAVGPRWLFELPFATAHGAAVAQFEIARDDGGRTAGHARALWRVRFSLDVEPLGPVHAQVVLGAKGRAGVTLWAEREECAERLREQASMLSLALQDANLPADVSVYAGAPRRARPPAGALLDRSS